MTAQRYLSPLLDVRTGLPGLGAARASLDLTAADRCIQAIYPYQLPKDYRDGSTTILRDWSPGQGTFRTAHTGYALDPNGTTGVVVLDSAISFTDDFTISAYVKIDGAISSAPIVTDAGTDNGLWLVDSTTVRVAIGGTNLDFTVGTMGNSTWYHVAAIRTSGSVIVTLDGEESVTGIQDNADTLASLQRLASNGTAFSSHILFDVRLFDRPLLLPSEIASLGAQDQPWRLALDTVGHWKLDESDGSTVYDSSGEGNDGTATDCAWYSGSDVPFSWHNEVGYSGQSAPPSTFVYLQPSPSTDTYLQPSPSTETYLQP